MKKKLKKETDFLFPIFLFVMISKIKACSRSCATHFYLSHDDQSQNVKLLRNIRGKETGRKSGWKAIKNGTKKKHEMKK